jgi:hypothetical protein
MLTLQNSVMSRALLVATGLILQSLECSQLAHTNPPPQDSLYIWTNLILIHTRIWWASGLRGNSP